MTYDEMLEKYIRKLGNTVMAGDVVYDLRRLDPNSLEVVRCADCEFRNGEKTGFCYGIQQFTENHDFCSRGIRKGTVKPDEVVRCRNCRYCFKHTRYINGGLVFAEYFCDVYGGKTIASHYCSWGERRETT